MYNYKEEKSKLFTEDGQVMFLKIRDKVNAIIEKSGAMTMGNIIQGIGGISWTQMACVDRMVELGELYEVSLLRPVAGQHRIFTKEKIM